MAEFTIDDMINSALASKPDTFRAAFDDVMVSKLAAAIEDKKQEIAQTMFDDNQEDQDDQELEHEEDEDLEQDDEVEDGEETEEHSDEE